MKQKLRKLTLIGMLMIAGLVVTILIGYVPAKAAGKSVRVSTEKALNKAVKNKNVSEIIFKTEAFINVTIKSNKAAASKYLEINAPNANITNKSTFNGINMQAARSYTEEANGNTYELYDDTKVGNFTVAKKKTVKSMTLLNPSLEIHRLITIRNGAKIEEFNLISSNDGNVIYSVLHSDKNIITFKYYLSKYDDYFSLEYKIDDSGRITKYKNEAPEFGCEYNYKYDADGNIVENSFGDMLGDYLGTDGFITYEYDSDFKLIREIHDEYDDQFQHQYQYELKYNYDKNGNLISRVNTDLKTGESKTDIKITYDKKGRMLSRTDLIGNKFVEKYKYNKKGFLTKYSYTYEQSKDYTYKFSETYKYNSAGDMTQRTTNDNGKKTTQKYKV
ncbi:MAG: hypothetical protein IKP88_15135 [Lachnospiraceae bacterium]|nr:hypothetical protein [Lachnospiraceae bacterium]